MVASYKRSQAGIFDVSDDGFNFKDEAYGTYYSAKQPSGWYLNIGYIVDYKGHTKCIKLTEASRDFSAGQDYGVMDGWFLTTRDIGGANDLIIALRDSGAATVGYVRIDCDTLDVFLMAADTTLNITSDTWFHVSFEWNNSGGNKDLRGDGNLADGDCRVYINGDQCGADQALNNGNDVTYGFFDGTNEDDYFDAICFTNLTDWNTDYSLDDNLTLAVDTSISTSNIYESTVHGRVMAHKKAEMTIDASENISKGTEIEITDNYSESGATASEVIFKGMVTSMSKNEPYKYLVESLAKEDLLDKPTNDESGRSDEIITAQTADINHIADGTHENGTAMGDMVFLGTKNYSRIWTNLAKFEGSFWYTWYDAGTLKINFNDTDTDTGVNIDQDDNIKILDTGSPARRITKIVVQGLDLASGSATASADDITNYGTNIFPHVDRTLSAALCGTAATNMLAVLNNDVQIIRFQYEIPGVGYIQEGQTITFAFEEEGSTTVNSAEFIVGECVYDSVNGSGNLILMSHPYYGDIDSKHLVQENSNQIDQNTTSVSTNTTSISSNQINEVQFALISYGLGATITWASSAAGCIYFPNNDTNGIAFWSGIYPNNAKELTNPTLYVLFGNDTSGDTWTGNLDVNAVSSAGGDMMTSNLYNAGFSFTAAAQDIIYSDTTVLSGTISAGDIVNVGIQKTSSDTRHLYVFGVFIK